MRERVSGRAIVERLREQLPEVGATIQELPQALHAILQRAAAGQLQVEVKSTGVDALRRELETGRRQRWRAGAASTLLLGGVLWLGLGSQPPLPGWALLAAGLALFLFSRPGSSS
jgi:hypothetical protein